MHRLLSMFGAPRRVAFGTVILFFGGMLGMSLSLALVGVAPLFASEAEAAEPLPVRAALGAPARSLSVKARFGDERVARERDDVALPASPIAIVAPVVIRRRHMVALPAEPAVAPPAPAAATSHFAMAIVPPPRTTTRRSKADAAPAVPSTPAATADAELLNRASAETTATLAGQ